MPRTLLDRNNGKFRKLGVLINGAADMDKKGAAEIGRAIGMGKDSANKYLRNPEKLSLEKLVKLGRNLNIPIEELRSCIRY